MALVWENLMCEGRGSFFERMQLLWFNTNKNQQLLTNLNGYINFGELTALMGPSGAGKSTLLNCFIQGENYGVRGRIAVESKYKMRSVFITQNERDHLLLNLTVTESFKYASEMKNEMKTTKEEHEDIVMQLLKELDLVKVANVMVAKCSGGQRKRIAIGLELTATQKPNFIFLDEPTSGLDSHSGFNIIARLRNLARSRNIAVVTVIHQPSFEIFSQFHNVYVLSKVGSCVFQGSPKQLQDNLIAYDYDTPNSNPADTIITIASSLNKDDNEELETITVDIEAGNSSVHSATIKTPEEMKVDCEKMTEEVMENWRKSSYANSGIQIQKHGLCEYSTKFKFYILFILLKRTFKTSVLRKKLSIFIRLALHVVVAIILASLYDRNLGVESGCYTNTTEFENCSCTQSLESMRYESIPNQNVKFQFFSLLFLMFAALMPTVLTFSEEIKLFISEYRNGWYDTLSYYISKTLTEIPFQIFFPFFYVYFLYWYSQQIGMDNWYGGFLGFMSDRYWWFLFVVVISCFVAQGIGFLIGILCHNSFPMAYIISSSVLLFLFLFSGFFVKRMDMNFITEQVTYLSFVRFSFESLLIIIYGKNRCELPAESAILYIFDIQDKDLVLNLLWLVGYHLIVFRVLAYVYLKNLANHKFLKTTSRYQYLFENMLPQLKEFSKYMCKSTIFLLQISAIQFSLQMIVALIILLNKW